MARHVLLAVPPGKRPKCWPGTRQCDYSPPWAWSRLGVEHADLPEVCEDREEKRVLQWTISFMYAPDLLFWSTWNLQVTSCWLNNADIPVIWIRAWCLYELTTATLHGSIGDINVFVWTCSSKMWQRCCRDRTLNVFSFFYCRSYSSQDKSSRLFWITESTATRRRRRFEWWLTDAVGDADIVISLFIVLFHVWEHAFVEWSDCRVCCNRNS